MSAQPRRVAKAKDSKKTKQQRAIRAYYSRTGPSTYVRGKGDYYVAGGAYGSGKIGPFKAGAALHGGYSSGSTVIPTVTGLGAYHSSKIRHNVLLHGDPPMIKNARYREGAIVIRHREYIQDIVSSSTANTFNIQSFPLNPGMQGSFPWLCTVANSFEEYVINGMIFEFKSITSDAISSASLATIGEVILATQYDALNTPFTNNQQMLNYEFAQVAKASHDCLHMIECDPHQTAISTHLYTRSGPAPGNSDLRLYDHGTFYIASNQISGTSVVLGQLWVTYEVLLYKPRISPVASYSDNMFKWFNATANQNNPLGSGTFKYNQENNLAITVTGNQIIFPTLAESVSYFINIAVGGFTAMSAAVPTLTRPNGNGTVLLMNVLGNNTAYQDVAPQAGLAGTTTTVQSIYVTVPAQSTTPILQFSNNVGYAANPLVDGLVAQIAYLDPKIYSYV